MKNFLNSFREKWSLNKEMRSARLTLDMAAARERTDRLVKARPAHLADTGYILAPDTSEVDQLFERLRTTLMKSTKTLPSGSRKYEPAVRFEYGKLQEGRPYFFFEPWTDSGWLFERSPHGWIISRANKNVTQNTFLRGEAWDIINVMKREDGEGLCRISSQRMGSEMLGFQVYEETLRSKITAQLHG